MEKGGKLFHMIATSDSQRIQVVILEASAISILRKLMLIFQDILLRTNLCMQVESSENGSRTVVKGRTALPPCSGFHFHFYFLTFIFLFPLFFFYFSFLNFLFSWTIAFCEWKHGFASLIWFFIFFVSFGFFVISVPKVQMINVSIIAKDCKNFLFYPKLSLPNKVCQNVTAAVGLLRKKAAIVLW